jgi:hypothetical protein
MRKRFVLAMVLAGLLALVPTAAFAHYPKVEATQDCDGVITYRVFSWNGDSDDAKTNPKIEVRLLRAEDDDGTVIDEGAFNPENDFQFSGTFQLDEPGDVILKVTALAKWANGASAGTSRDTEVKAPDGDECEETTTSTSISTETTLPPPTTVVSVDSTTPDSSVAPETTEGGALPFTGSNTMPLLAVGLALVVCGLVALRFAGRARG